MNKAIMNAVELAPQHKVGLALTNPILLACGVVGYGDAVAPGLEIDPFTMQLDSIFALADLAAELVKAVRAAADLPVLVRLPLHLADEAIEPVLEAGADALVLAQPPIGLRLDPATLATVRGGMHGPGLQPLIATRLAELAGWVGVPMVACGGVHNLEDALTYLAIGAKAVQIDTAVWVDPGLPNRIVAALAGT